MKTFFVGLDIAKFKHDCFIADETGNVIRDSFSFQNNMDGFNILLPILNDLKRKGQIRIGFESTGHYHFNLKLFLEKNGFSYLELNPLLVKRFITGQSLRRTKTDKKDASMISKYLMTLDYKPYVNSFYHINDLKSLTRLRESLITERTKFLNQIIAYLDQIFPEFKPLFPNGLNPSAFYLLNNYLTPKRMAKLDIVKYTKMKSCIKNPISYQKICQIKEVASNTIGNSSKTLEFALKTSLNTYSALNSEIEKLEKEISTSYLSLDYHIHTIKGIGIISAAGIASEIGNFDRFTSQSQILAYAGLECSKLSSGISDPNGKMVKHGSSYLRKYLMNTAETFYVFNPTISDFYWKKRNEGKCHRVALSHVARKLVNVIFTLEKNHIDFNQSSLR